MQVSEQVIDILEYLADKIGITIDWTSNNVLPYLEELCRKFIEWQIYTSIAWIVLAVVTAIIVFIIAKVEDELWFFWIALAIAIIIIGVQSFDIIEAITFPEKAIYEYIQFNYDQR